MYLTQLPHVVSRSIVFAPVNAPKYSVLVSTAIGAARTIVGVPTLPISASTAFAPRDRPVVDTAVVLPWPSGSGVVDDGQLGDVSRTCTSVSVRAFCSAMTGS